MIIDGVILGGLCVLMLCLGICIGYMIGLFFS